MGKINKNNGFTLLETLIALIILSSGIILLAQSWSSSTIKIQKSQISYEVAALLERKMFEIENEYKDKPLESIPEEKEDDFGSDHPQYSWKMTSRDFELPDLTGLLTSKAGGADQMMLTLTQQLSDHLSKSIKEVKVTIIYKTSKKNLEYSATQYFVNYDKEIAMPGLPGGGGI